MKNIILGSIFLLSLSMEASAANPLSGKMARWYCYEITEKGNPDSVKPGFAVVIDLVESGKFDATQFVKTDNNEPQGTDEEFACLLYTSPSPRDS